jgi:hypothetical protein
MARDTEKTGIVNYGGNMEVTGCAVGTGATIVIKNGRVVETSTDEDTDTE